MRGASVEKMLGNDPLLRRRESFTLIELMLVAVMLALMSSVMTPRMSRAYRSLELRGAASEVLSSVRMAAELAIRERVETRLVIEQEGREFWIERDDLRSPAQKMDLPERGPLAQKRSLGRGMTISFKGPRQAALEGERRRTVSFFPDGTRSETLIELADRNGRKRWIEVGRTMGDLKIHEKDPTLDEK